MSNHPRPRRSMSLGSLSLRQLAVGIWKRMEEHDSMTWAAAVAFYAMLATVPFLAIVLVGVVLRPFIGTASNNSASATVSCVMPRARPGTCTWSCWRIVC
jgi:uncharacterized BrkB/YihY/UPF0761 family membrane protein